jgi:F-type H+-transporting ATPase subunit b
MCHQVRYGWASLLLAALWALAPAGLAAQEEKAGEEPAAKVDDHAKGEKSSATADDHAEPDDHGKATGESHGTAAETSTDGHTDPYDIGHGNATANLTQPQEWRFDLSIWTFVVFLLLLAILTKFAWGPIAAALEQREETIARQIEEARLASQRAATQLKQYEARLAAATDEARQIVGQARKDADVAREKIVAEAQAAAQRERDRAVAEITAAKNQALDEIAQKSVQTAVSLASNIVRREVKASEHEALIGDALSQFSKLN